jgi:hypothetical protein
MSILYECDITKISSHYLVYKLQGHLIVACKPSRKHREGDESLCTLEAFKEVIEKVRPLDVKEECRLIGTTLIYQANVLEEEKAPKYPRGAHQ